MKKNTGMPKWRINLRKQSAQEALFLHGAPAMPAAGSQGIVCVGLSAWWAPAHRCMDTTQRLLVWEWRPKLQNLYGRPWAKMTHVTTLPSDEWHYLCWVVISLWIFYLHCPFTPRKYFRGKYAHMPLASQKQVSCTKQKGKPHLQSPNSHQKRAVEIRNQAQAKSKRGLFVFFLVSDIQAVTEA